MLQQFSDARFFFFSATIILLFGGPLFSDAKFTTYWYAYEGDGNTCIMDIWIDGNGIQDTVTMSCTVAADIELVMTSTGFVLGDYRKIEDRTCAFTDSENNLVVIQGRKRSCNRRVKKENIVTTPLDRTECDTVKLKMNEVLDNRDSITDAQEMFKIHFKNTVNFVNSVCIILVEVKSEFVETLELSCITARGVELMYVPGGFVLGDYRKHGVSMFADTADTLILIQGIEGLDHWSCTRDKFEKGEKTKSELMFPSECNAIKQKIAEYWDKQEGKIIRINQYY